MRTGRESQVPTGEKSGEVRNQTEMQRAGEPDSHAHQAQLTSPLLLQSLQPAHTSMQKHAHTYACTHAANACTYMYTHTCKHT